MRLVAAAQSKLLLLVYALAAAATKCYCTPPEAGPSQQKLNDVTPTDPPEVMDGAAHKSLTSHHPSDYETFSSHRKQPAPFMGAVDDESKVNGSTYIDHLVNKILENSGDALDLGAHNNHNTHHIVHRHGTLVERSGDELIAQEPLTAAESSSAQNAADGAAQVFGTGINVFPPANHHDLATGSQTETDEHVTVVIADHPMLQEIDKNEDDNDRHIQYDSVHVAQKRAPTELFITSSGNGRHLSDYKISSAELPYEQTVNNNTTDRRFNPSELSPSPKFQATSPPVKASAKQLDLALNKLISTISDHQRSTINPPQPVTANSTSVVDVVAPSPLLDEQMTTLSAANITGRSLDGAQARSMYSGSSSGGGGLFNSNANINKTPQHTRPPYASHDQFSHKSSSSPVDAAEPAYNNNSSLETTANQHVGQLPARQMATSATTESAGSRSGDSRVYQNHEDHQKHSNIHKLANSHEVELNPTPIGSTRAPGHGGDTRGGAERLHYSKESSQFGHPNRAHNDKYSAAGLPTYYDPASSLNDLPGGYYSADNNNKQQQHMEEDDNSSSSRDGPPSTYAPSRDYAASRYQLSGLDAAESQQHAHRHHHMSSDQHPVPSASGALFVRPVHSHYAASLVNVTGPLNPPHSASDALKAALGGGQAAENLLNLASGLQRPAPQGLDPALVPGAARFQPGSFNNSAARQPQQQPYLPAYSGSNSDGLQPPANQFSPNFHGTQSDTNSSATTMSNSDKERMRLDGYNTRRPPIHHQQQHSSAINVSQANPASGFRGQSYAAHLASTSNNTASLWPTTSSPHHLSYLGGALNTASQQQQPQASGAAPVVVATPQLLQNTSSQQQHQAPRPPAAQHAVSAQNLASSSSSGSNNASANAQSIATSTTNGFITSGTGSAVAATNIGAGAATSPDAGGSSGGLNRRVFNLTRVEHITAECSNDLIRTMIIFNGTFKGIIYSSGYVRDPNCLYINGTGKTRYDFSIRLNQCGTLGHQETRPPARPNEVSRRDQVMWNTLSIQYNPIIEQEWDEHFKVSCEYGSDFWKTVSFSPFNVETNTGAPVVFTVDPPQCQMEILRGHGMVGPRQEAISGPVTVGDPLTLLIHMKAEKAGYDILVKNCVAHNGGHQKMQLIDSNGCVVNERFISPFRGAFNDNDLKHVTLYSYLKAFRFTGSPVLYLECEIHMCQSSCPPQMCYWRQLTKRSTTADAEGSNLLGYNNSTDINGTSTTIYDASSLASTTMTTTAIYQEPKAATTQASSSRYGKRRGRKMNLDDSSPMPSANKASPAAATSDGQVSDGLRLFVPLEVRQDRGPPDAAPYSMSDGNNREGSSSHKHDAGLPLMCYRRTEVLAFLFTAVSLILVALSVSVGCCWRAANLRLQDNGKRLAAVCSIAAGSTCANSTCPTSPPLSCSGSSSSLSSCTSGTSLSPKNSPRIGDIAHQQASSSSSPSNYYHTQGLSCSSSAYRKALHSVGPIMVLPGQHPSKQRHKECLISPSY